MEVCHSANPSSWYKIVGINVIIQTISTNDTLYHFSSWQMIYIFLCETCTKSSIVWLKGICWNENIPIDATTSRLERTPALKLILNMFFSFQFCYVSIDSMRQRLNEVISIHHGALVMVTPMEQWGIRLPVLVTQRYINALLLTTGVWSHHTYARKNTLVLKRMRIHCFTIG